MLQFLLLIGALALLAGIVIYGLGKVVVISVLVAVGVAFATFIAVGISASVASARTAKPDPNNPSADEFRAMQAQAELDAAQTLQQARSLAMKAEPTVPAAPPAPERYIEDEELKRLRHMTGLD